MWLHFSLLSDNLSLALERSFLILWHAHGIKQPFFQQYEQQVQFDYVLTDLKMPFLVVSIQPVF
jgi:CheY-like chemotaxis protein